MAINKRENELCKVASVYATVGFSSSLHITFVASRYDVLSVSNLSLLLFRFILTKVLCP